MTTFKNAFFCSVFLVVGFCPAAFADDGEDPTQYLPLKRISDTYKAQGGADAFRINSFKRQTFREHTGLMEAVSSTWNGDVAIPHFYSYDMNFDFRKGSLVIHATCPVKYFAGDVTGIYGAEYFRGRHTLSFDEPGRNCRFIDSKTKKKLTFVELQEVYGYGNVAGLFMMLDLDYAKSELIYSNVSDRTDSLKPDGAPASAQGIGSGSANRASSD